MDVASAMTAWRWYFATFTAILTAEVCFHVVTSRSLQNQFPDLYVRSAVVLPPCSDMHWFGTYVYSKDDAGTKHWMHACRDWDAGRWVLVSLD